MELKEAIKYLEEIKEKDKKWLKEVNENIEGGLLNDINAIEAVLQALENSIPKEKVHKEIDKLEELTKDKTKTFCYTNYRYTLNILEKLLEEENEK